MELVSGFNSLVISHTKGNQSINQYSNFEGLLPRNFKFLVLIVNIKVSISLKNYCCLLVLSIIFLAFFCWTMSLLLLIFICEEIVLQRFTAIEEDRYNIVIQHSSFVPNEILPNHFPWFRLWRPFFAMPMHLRVSATHFCSSVTKLTI